MSGISIYLSYAHKDEEFAYELQQHLRPLSRQTNVTILDNPIRPGSDSSKERDNNINEADIILLLVSPAFMASDYAYSVEMQRAMARNEAGEAYVIPIIIRPVHWQDTLFDQLQVLPSGGKPITAWVNRDEAFFNVVQGIQGTIKRVSNAHLTPSSIRETTPEQVVASLPKNARDAAKIGKPSILKNALEEYHKNHTSERLVIKDKDEFFYYENIAQVTYIWQIWQTLSEIVAERKQNRLMPLLKELLSLLALSLSAEANSTITETDSPLFFYTLLNMQNVFTNLNMTKQLPVIFYTERIFGIDQKKDLHQLLKNITPSSHFAVMLFFSIGQTPSNVSQKYLKHFQQSYAYDIMPMFLNDFLKITEARDSGKIFRQWLLSQVDLSIISPFTTSGPTPDDMFFGREQELRTIQEHAGTASYALIGGRRIGKTSILKRLWRIGLPGKNMRAFYLDCSYIQTQADLIQAVTVDRSWFPVPPSSPFSSFANAIQALPSDKPLVLLIDEADKLIEPDKSAGYPLLNMLRALSMSGRCQYVFGGEYALRSDMQNPKSPLFNFANMVLVGHLNPRAARELIIQPMRDLEIELEDEDKIVERIWNFTAGHPNVIQRLCQRLVMRINGYHRLRLSMDDVEMVLTNTDFLRDDFLDTYWGQATLLERLCTLVMAKQQDIHTLVDIHAALISLDSVLSLSDVNEALERLVSLRNLLHRTPQGYAFAVTDFPRVIAQTYELNDLIALTYDKYEREKA